MRIQFQKQYKVVIATSLLVSFLWLVFFVLNGNASQAKPLAQPVIPSLAPMLENITDAVVNVSTTARRKQTAYQGLDFFNDPILRHYFAPYSTPQENAPRQQNLGSGVIIDADKGYVLTNNHVIEDADNILVTLKDGRKLDAELIGTDKKTDIALLKVNAKDLIAIPLGNSDQLRVGDFVVAIGNPFGIGQTVTSGIISALGRNNLGIEGYEDFIQTDASINPGNSGGALVDLRGRLIGINTAILSKSGGNVGIGFAIPVNMTRSIVKQLVMHGKVSRGILGVHIQDLTPELAQALAINVTSGAIVAKVIKDSAADKAGLKNGDIITRANQKTIRNATDLRNTIGLMQPGEKVRLELYRNDHKMALDAIIGGEDFAALNNGGFDAGTIHTSLRGAVLRKKAGRRGLVVSAVKKYSNAWRTGLQVDDRIVSINRFAIDSLSDLKQFLRHSHQRMALNIIRGNTGLYLLLE